MNEIFKKATNIKLDDNYSLEPDNFRGIVLVFKEQRKREKIEAKTKKKTGVFEDYIFENKWYYPKLSMVLNKYLSLKQCDSKDVLDLLNKTIKVEEVINKINK
jgi:hypothetical protein